PTAPVALADPANESLGGVSLGDPAARAIAVLGEPTEKSEVQEWAATGDRISEWTWAQGASFQMAEVDGAFVVHGMSLRAPSTLATSRGIGIGATFEQVDAAYKEFRGKGAEEGEPEQWDLENGITVGSVYGGTMFSFESGKVSTIFIGAAAE
ncbi:MAG TPA: hypothetical protein VM261_15855, partial [Kofleriaceae bacterium]|nr:hypothetical protein [Kofleriaceae bacterium]